MNRLISVLLVDEMELFRAGLKAIINNEGKCFVIGEATTGAELIKKSHRLKPDIVICNYSIQDRGGVNEILKLKDSLPELKCIIITMEFTEKNVYKAWQAGIDGMLNRDCNSEELLYAIHNVASKGIYYSGIKNEEEIQKLPSNILSKTKIKSQNYNFTKKELDILDLLESGLTSEQIAEKLFIGKRTVDFYRGKLIQKLGLKSSNELIAFAVKYKIFKSMENF